MSWQKAVGVSTGCPGDTRPAKPHGCTIRQSCRGTTRQQQRQLRVPYPTLDFSRDPQPHGDGASDMAVPSQPGTGLRTEVLMTLSPAAAIPSQAKSLIPMPVCFAQCLDPRLQRTYHREEEREEKAALLDFNRG